MGEPVLDCRLCDNAVLSTNQANLGANFSGAFTDVFQSSGLMGILL
jgi:hypothetical protein